REALDDIFKDNNSSKAVKQLKDGYMMETLIDPHPAHNDRPQRWAGENHQYSASHGVSSLEGIILSQYRSFQSIVQDPNTTIPPNVRAAADFYQHTTVKELPPFSILDPYDTSEALLNLWGEDPSLITNRSGVKVRDLNVTGQGMGHSEIL